MGFAKAPYGRLFPKKILRSSVTRIKRNLKVTVLQEVGIDSKLLNQIQWSWYHSLLRKMLYLMMSKNMKFFAGKVLKIRRSAFYGTPGIAWRGQSLITMSGLNFKVICIHTACNYKWHPPLPPPPPSACCWCYRSTHKIVCGLKLSSQWIVCSEMLKLSRNNQNIKMFGSPPPPSELSAIGNIHRDILLLGIITLQHVIQNNCWWV